MVVGRRTDHGGRRGLFVAKGAQSADGGGVRGPVVLRQERRGLRERADQRPRPGGRSRAGREHGAGGVEPADGVFPGPLHVPDAGGGAAARDREIRRGLDARPAPAGQRPLRGGALAAERQDPACQESVLLGRGPDPERGDRFPAHQRARHGVESLSDGGGGRYLGPGHSAQRIDGRADAAAGFSHLSLSGDLFHPLQHDAAAVQRPAGAAGAGADDRQAAAGGEVFARGRAGGQPPGAGRHGPLPGGGGAGL